MKEKPKPFGSGVYRKHRVMLKKAARSMKVSEGEVVRQAIQSFCMNMDALAKINRKHVC